VSILTFFRSNADGTELPVPNLSAETLVRWRRLSTKEQGRLMRRAETEAAASLRLAPTRDPVDERDGWIELLLSGHLERMTQIVQEQFTDPGPWQHAWRVVTGQDDPPDGLWGWMILEANTRPPSLIMRVPDVCATESEARAAGETAAAEIWIKFNRQLAGM